MHLTSLKAVSVSPVFLWAIQNLRPHSKPTESDLWQGTGMCVLSASLNWLYLPSVTEFFNFY